MKVRLSRRAFTATAAGLLLAPTMKDSVAGKHDIALHIPRADGGGQGSAERERLFRITTPASALRSLEANLRTLQSLVGSTNRKEWRGIRQSYGLIVEWGCDIALRRIYLVTFEIRVWEDGRPWNEVPNIAGEPIHAERRWPNWDWREVTDTDSQRSEA